MANSLLADSLLQNHDYAAALPIAQRAYQLAPDAWDTSYNLSSAYFALGDYPQAEHYLLEAMRKAPQERSEYYYLLALNRIKMGRWADAESALRRGIQLSPGAPGMHSGLGAVLRTEGRLVEARDEFALEVKLHPDNVAAQRELADIEDMLGAQTQR
jgi:Flp pilus assembly protein TadD